MIASPLQGILQVRWACIVGKAILLQGCIFQIGGLAYNNSKTYRS